MAEVLEYVLIAGGNPYKGEGISHFDALNRFIEKPASHYGYHGGNYATQEGEQITVVGMTQDDLVNYRTKMRSRQALKEHAASGRKGAKEAREKLVTEHEPNQPTASIVTFIMEAHTTFVPREVGDKTELELRIPQLREKIGMLSGERVRLKVNAYRVHPEIHAEKILVGYVDEAKDGGVWMNGHLVPWADIDDIVAEPVEVKAEA